MNWHWLLEILEEAAMPREDIVLANPFKTRIIAEAQIKTDKVDARILADLLRANLIAKVHICGKATRDLKEMLRQRCFFVRQRTMGPGVPYSSTPWRRARAETAPVQRSFRSQGPELPG